MLTEKDEFRHPADEDINWNESYYFNFVDSENSIAGFFRMGLQENKNESNVWCHLMKDGKPIYNRFRLNVPYSKKAIDNLLVADLRFEVLEPYKKFRIMFKDRHLDIDLVWESFTEVFDAMGELPTVAVGHYDQMGEIRGQITIEEEKIGVSGHGFRDHSWGPRVWDDVKWKVAFGQFKRDFAFFVAELYEVNGRRTCMGYFFDGKENISLAKVDLKIDFYGDGLTPQRGMIETEDKQGAIRRIAAEPILVCPMPHDFNLNQECYSRFQMGEKTGYGVVELNCRLYGKFSKW